VVEVAFLVAVAGAAKEIVLDGVELHIQQARSVVRALQEGAHAQKVKRLVLQHGAQHHTA